MEEVFDSSARVRLRKQDGSSVAVTSVNTETEININITTFIPRHAHALGCVLRFHLVHRHQSVFSYVPLSQYMQQDG
jgi:hypothetical protein